MTDAGIPEETGSTLARMDDCAGIAIRRWGPPAPERVVISHGNGLAIDAFAAFGAALIARGFEVVAFDMRNHGRNPPAPATEPNWPRFIRDFPAIMQAIDAAFGPKPAHGAFHSLSSITCLMSQSLAAYPWRTLTLFEPPIPPDPASAGHAAFIVHHEALSARAAKRRAIFADPLDLAASMRRSSLFRLVPPDAIDRLARATTRPDGQGGWTLCCPPAFEAETFGIDALRPMRAGLANVTCPVRVVVGQRDIHYAPELVDAGRELAADFGFGLVEMRDATHFMQLERPEASARLVAGGDPAPGDRQVRAQRNKAEEGTR